MIKPFRGIYLNNEQSSHPAFYLYEFSADNRSRLGLIAAVPLKWLKQKKIVKHELVYNDKVLQYTKSLNTQHMQLSPILLTFRDNKLIEQTLNLIVKKSDLSRFTSFQEGVHRLFEIKDEQLIDHLTEVYVQVDKYYIADGHHRLEAFAKIEKQQSTHRNELYFLGCLMGENQVIIMNYAKLILKLEYKMENFLNIAQKFFELVPLDKHDLQKTFIIAESLMYINSQWFSLQLKDEIRKNLVGHLSPQCIVNRYLFENILNIYSHNQGQFILSIKQEEPLNKIGDYVECNNFAAAFCFRPLTVKDIFSIADLNGIFPINTTYFEPKIPSTLINFPLSEYLSLSQYIY